LLGAVVGCSWTQVFCNQHALCFKLTECVPSLCGGMRFKATHPLLCSSCATNLHSIQPCHTTRMKTFIHSLYVSMRFKATQPLKPTCMLRACAAAAPHPPVSKKRLACCAPVRQQHQALHNTCMLCACAPTTPSPQSRHACCAPTRHHHHALNTHLSICAPCAIGTHPSTHTPLTVHQSLLPCS
jgi:hypothetical protein